MSGPSRTSGGEKDPPRTARSVNEADLREVVDLLGKRWALSVLHLLSEGRLRRSSLKHHLDGISDKVLTEVLKDLGGAGLVNRHLYAAVPPRVEYELTGHGHALLTALRPLREWTNSRGATY